MMAPAYKAVGSIMNLTFYPYGNAKETQQGGKWVFTCQHGASECLGNMIEACAIKYHQNSTAEWVNFISCCETSSQPVDKVGASCASKQGWTDYSTGIMSCVNGKEGNDLMHSIAVATQSLQPPHQWTPWVVMNGKPLTESQLDQSLTKLVCNAYQGTKPPGCKAISEKLDLA